MEEPPTLATWETRLGRPSPEFPRRFVPGDFRASEWQSLEPLCRKLLESPVDDLPQLQASIERFSEFRDVVHEEESRLYIGMTCDTRDAAKKKAFLHFSENIQPKLEDFQNQYFKKITASPAWPELTASKPSSASTATLKTGVRINTPQESSAQNSAARKASADKTLTRNYGRWPRSVANQLALFDSRNLDLQVKETGLLQQYKEITGNLNAEWDGETKTLIQIQAALEDPDRNRRERAWNTIREQREAVVEPLEELFGKLFHLRRSIASNLGLKDYREYCFKRYERDDYDPEYCHQFKKVVVEAVLPRYRKLLEKRKKALGVDTLRPWDLNCDYKGRAPLKPFDTNEELLNGVGAIFQKVDPELAAYFETMREYGLLDLENRMGKAPGGYQCSLDEVRYPFIFMNSVKLNGDVYTLLHESGHSFHYFLSRGLPYGFTREAPMEFCEVASMSMELIGQEVDTFYNPADKARAVAYSCEEVLRILCWVVQVDGFQHWLYTHPEHTVEERRRAWLDLSQELDTGVSWEGFDSYAATYWHRQLHIFEHPFYYIEYGIAQLGALQMWQLYQKNPAMALEHYKKALSLGGTRGLKELFAEAGLQFEAKTDWVAPLMDSLLNLWETSMENME